MPLQGVESFELPEEWRRMHMSHVDCAEVNCRMEGTFAFQVWERRQPISSVESTFVSLSGEELT